MNSENKEHITFVSIITILLFLLGIAIGYRINKGINNLYIIKEISIKSNNIPVYKLENKPNNYIINKYILKSNYNYNIGDTLTLVNIKQLRENGNNNKRRNREKSIE